MKVLEVILEITAAFAVGTVVENRIDLDIGDRLFISGNILLYIEKNHRINRRTINVGDVYTRTAMFLQATDTPYLTVYAAINGGYLTDITKKYEREKVLDSILC